MKMLEKLQRRLQEGKKDNKGFSLVELIIVIAIMAILIGIVGMNVIPQIENARRATDAEVLSALVTEGMEAWTQVDNAATTVNITISVNSDGKLSLSGGSASDDLKNKLIELSFTGTGANRVLKSNAGKDLKAHGFVINFDPASGVDLRMPTAEGGAATDAGKLDGFDGYAFVSR